MIILRIINLSLILISAFVHETLQTESQDCAVISPSAGLLQAAGFSPECVAMSLVNCHCSGMDNGSDKKKHIRPRNCMEVLENNDIKSGLKTIYPWRSYPTVSETVFCDQETDGGGWIVIQQRLNLSVREDFYRTWEEYRVGFGSKDKEFWLGNDLISEITTASLQTLRIDLKDYEEERKWAKYEYFYVEDSTNNFKIHVGRYNGTAGDGLNKDMHDGRTFSTHDRDNDVQSHNCAKKYVFYFFP